MEIFKLLTLIPVIFSGNKEFFKIINDFKRKLPPSNKKSINKVQPQLGVMHMDLTPMQSHISTKDLDLFLKELELFNYNRILVKKKEIKSFSLNLQRILKSDNFERFKIGLLQEILDSEKWASRSPYVFGHKIGNYINF